MLTKDAKRLAIFDDFWVDDELPIHVMHAAAPEGAVNPSADNDTMAQMSVGLPVTGGGGLFAARRMSARRGRALLEAGRAAAQSFPQLPSEFQELMVMAKDQMAAKGRRFARSKPVEKPPVVLSVPKFFAAIKNSAEELVVVESRATGYQKAIEQALANGQIAFADKLRGGLKAARSEAQLLALGLPRYLEEAKVVEFATKSERALRLDWILNFTRVIPEPVLLNKRRADAAGVFDNYAVLHYDPTGESHDSTAMAKRETKKAIEEKKRDPILFGLIEGRRRLYVVGDWVDEFCDLTLDRIAEVIGASAVRELGGAFEP